MYAPLFYLPLLLLAHLCPAAQNAETAEIRSALVWQPNTVVRGHFFRLPTKYTVDTHPDHQTAMISARLLTYALANASLEWARDNIQFLRGYGARFGDNADKPTASDIVYLINNYGQNSTISYDHRIAQIQARITYAVGELGANLNPTYHEADTPLHAATQHCSLPIVQTLLLLKADPRQKGNHTKTVLHDLYNRWNSISMIHGSNRDQTTQWEIFYALIGAGADPLERVENSYWGGPIAKLLFNKQLDGIARAERAIAVQKEKLGSSSLETYYNTKPADGYARTSPKTNRDVLEESCTELRRQAQDEKERQERDRKATEERARQTREAAAKKQAAEAEYKRKTEQAEAAAYRYQCCQSGIEHSNPASVKSAIAAGLDPYEKPLAYLGTANGRPISNLVEYAENYFANPESYRVELPPAGCCASTRARERARQAKQAGIRAQQTEILAMLKKQPELPS